MAKNKIKPTKITQEELIELQGTVKAINNIQMDLGSIEVQKAQMIGAALKFRDKLSEKQNNLKEKYGNVNIDITDGSIKPAEDGEVNKKN
jgi:hypothetical protein|tara:strand:- start:160 stop:429 length:270 start_codon:yes stop_codon:yes gene_type:complete